MDTVYFGIRLPERSYERLSFENINFNEKISNLKFEVQKKIDYPNSELVFIYLGSELNDNQTLKDEGVRPGTTIHVFPQQKPSAIESNRFDNLPPISMTEIIEICKEFRFLFMKMKKTISREIIKKVLDEYPEYYKDLGALAILKDSVLNKSLCDPETTVKLSKEYPILLRSARFILDAWKTVEPAAVIHIGDSNESTDESSSNSDSESSPTTSAQTQPNRRLFETATGDIRRISRDQLAAALLSVGTSSTNSLSNIAQRNNEQSSEPVVRPSTTPAISNSRFSDALAQALRASQSTGSAETTATDTNTTNEQPMDHDPILTGIRDQLQQYQSELAVMHEMGLTDQVLNLQALAVCNGDVQAAIHFLFSGSGNMFD